MRALIAVLVASTVATGMGAAISGPAAAGAFEIAPTTIDIAPGADRAVFYITNHGSQPIVVQIQGFDWRQTDGGEQLDRSDALTISPPMARLVPERRQTVRLAIGPGAAPAERSFRLVASELPDPQATAPQGVRVLLQLSVPVFAAGTHPTPARLTWSAVQSPGGISLAARNTGTRHAKLMEMFVTTADGAKIALAPGTISYVLAGVSRRWAVALPGRRAGETLRITGLDDSDGTTIGAPITLAP
ncbi:MAG: fimbria/pilus periplasmic chaperone [Rhizomicrobium sp.]